MAELLMIQQVLQPVFRGPLVLRSG